MTVITNNVIIKKNLGGVDTIFIVAAEDRILPAEIRQIMDALSEDGSVNFRTIRQDLAQHSLSPEFKMELAQLAVSKVVFLMKHGAWEHLRGAKELIAFLGVEKIELAGKWAQVVGEYYKSFSYKFLTDLRPALYNGQYWHGKGKGYEKYEEMEFARMKLREAGMPENKLTDSYVQCLWNVRELLILLHQHNAVLNSQPSLEHILELTETCVVR